jgi:hypothetical protein
MEENVRKEREINPDISQGERKWGHKTARMQVPTSI